VPQCDRCGAAIGRVEKWDGPLRFCSVECLRAGPVGGLAIQVSAVEVEQAAWAIRQAPCPCCHEHRPVDLYESYRIWSVLVFTTWHTRVTTCCSPCAQARRKRDAIFSALFGWWGFPFGIIWTPVQVFRNIRALIRHEESPRPSRQFLAALSAQLYEKRLMTALSQSNRGV
jgi:hypothetical protein